LSETSHTFATHTIWHTALDLNCTWFHSQL
jgi:hypothetical protein